MSEAEEPSQPLITAECFQAHTYTCLGLENNSLLKILNDDTESLCHWAVGA